MNTHQSDRVKGVVPRMRRSFVRLVPALLALALLGPVGGPATVCRAADPAVDVATQARSLQLEGTQLQLKGDIKGALEKYHQSLALKPNERLEKLVERLERHAGKKAPSPTVAGPGGSVPTVQNGTMPGGGEAVTPPAATETGAATVEVGEQPPKPETPSAPPVVHHPATPEEGLVYDFVDWGLDNLLALTDQAGATLEVNRDYTVTREGDFYQARVEPLILHVADSDDGQPRQVDLGPVTVRCQVEGADQVAASLLLPERISFVKNGAESFALVSGQRQVDLVWHRQDKSFSKIDLEVGDLAVDFSRAPGAESQKDKEATLKKLSFHTELADVGNGQWKETYSGGLEGFSLGDGLFGVTLGKIAFSMVGHGGDLENYKALRQEYSKLAEAGEDLKLADLQPVSRSLDRYLELLGSSEGRIILQDFHVSEDGNFDLASAELTGTMTRKEGKGGFAFQGGGSVKGISYMGEGGENPVGIVLNEVYLKDSFSLNPIPANLFSDLFDGLSKAEQMTDEQARDEFLGNLGLEYGKKFLSLFGDGSSEIGLNGLEIHNVMPQPLMLAKAVIGAGFDTRGNEGGTVNLHMNFDGFHGMDEQGGTVPEAAALNLQVSHIPSLLDLINNPQALGEGDVGQLQGQVMMNGMNALMASGLSLSLMDSFVAFPATRLALDLNAKVDQTATFMSTGTMKMAIENPDKFSEIINGLLGDPDIQQMLATITAMANRTTEKGKTVDRIDVELTPEGKIMMNNKDVTAMFLPQAAPQGQPPAGEEPFQAVPGPEEQGAAGPQAEPVPRQ